MAERDVFIAVLISAAVITVVVVALQCYSDKHSQDQRVLSTSEWRALMIKHNIGVEPFQPKSILYAAPARRYSKDTNRASQSAVHKVNHGQTER